MVVGRNSVLAYSRMIEPRPMRRITLKRYSALRGLRAAPPWWLRSAFQFPGW